VFILSLTKSVNSSALEVMDKVVSTSNPGSDKGLVFTHSIDPYTLVTLTPTCPTDSGQDERIASSTVKATWILALEEGSSIVEQLVKFLLSSEKVYLVGYLKLIILNSLRSL
jgi:hypothetical protein